MSDFDVKNFTYDYALKCYRAYASGDVNAPDSMYQKGMEVANDPKWLSDVTKWQTKDINVYDMEEDEHKAQDTENPDGTEGKILKFGEKAGFGIGASSPEAIIKSAPTITAACMSSPTGIFPFSAYGILFLTVTSAYKSMAMKDRNNQETYFKNAEAMMKEVDFDALEAKAHTMNQEVTAYTQQAENLAKAAGIQVAAANTVSSATAVSEQNVSVSAQAIADEGAAKVESKLDSIDKGILSVVPDIELVCEEINKNKELTISIKENYNTFEQNRETMRKTMESLAIAAGICIAGSGAVFAAGLLLATISPTIITLFTTAVTAFTAALIVALTELKPQNKAKEDLEKNEENTDNWLNRAKDASGTVKSIYSTANTNESTIQAQKDEAAEESVNVAQAA